MLKKIRKIRSQRGTALLISILVMGILTTISLAISALIVRELSITRLTLDYGKAYYAAESGVEVALLKLDNELPGYEVKEGESGGSFNLGDGSSGSDLSSRLGTYASGFSDGAKAAFTISNQANEYPYFDPLKYDIEKAPAEAFYDYLDLNQSITIPLFAVDKDGKVSKVTKFRVQFYVKFKKDDLKFKNADLSGWDVLRWKIYGINNENETESINDFTAVSLLLNGTSGDTRAEMTNAGSPSWFGSVNDCSPENANKGLSGKIQCMEFGQSLDPGSDFGQPGASVKNVSGQDVYSGVCFPWEAREHYFYDNSGNVETKPCYPIKDFLGSHKFNYLTLTNLMNPDVFDSGIDRAHRMLLSRLYFRIEAYDGSLVREYADITATGESGDSKVKLNVLKKRDSYLPVFNFAVYHTGE
jgi:hypothetical protein